MRNPAAPCPARLDRDTKALNEVGASFACGILQGDEKTARRRRRIGKVAAAPDVGVESAVRRRDHVADVAEIVCKYGGAKAWREGEAAVVGRARRFLRWSVAVRGAETSGHACNRRHNSERRGDE